MFLFRFSRIICIVILNLLIQPMYAGDTLLLSKELTDQKEGTFHLARDTSPQDQETSMVQGSSSWMPAIMGKTASYISSMSSKSSALRRLWGKSCESHKDGLLLDFSKPVLYDAEDFQDDIEDIATSDAYNKPEYKQLRLRKLQDHVWQGEISPYTYDQGLKNLELYVSKADISRIREEFESKVRSFQSFIDSNFQRDLLSSLEDLQDSSSLVAFEELLAYYRPLLNPFDYANTLAQCGESVIRNDYLKEDQRKALYVIILNNLRQIDIKNYRKIEAERTSIELALEKLPFYNQSLPKGFNSSLSPRKTQQTVGSYTDTKESNFSLVSALKGFAYALYKGTRYAVSHPRQVLALGLAAHVIPIAAQTGNDFLINQMTNDNQQYPSAAGLTNGNVFVAWQDARSGNYDIYGRVFFPNGTALGSDFIINQITTNNQLDPSVSELTNGNVLVAWEDARLDTSYPEIYGRVFFPNGTALGSDFIINQIETGEHYNPSVSGLTNGNVLVAWEDYRAGTYDIHGRVLFPNGTALGSDFIINQITTNNQYNPSVSGLTNGTVFVAWDDFRVGNSEPDIYGRVLFPNGTALGSEFIINQITTGDQWFPSVSGLPNGTVFVAWQDFRAGVDIYGRVLFPNGTALGSEFIINQITTNEQSYPSVSGLTNGNVFVAWNDFRASTTNPDIYGRVFFPNGTALGSEFLINQITTNGQFNPSVSGLANGNVFVAWYDNRAGTTNPDIYGRIFSDLDLISPNSSLYQSLSASSNPSPTTLSLTLTNGGTGSMTNPTSQIASTNPEPSLSINSGIPTGISTISSSFSSSVPSSSNTGTSKPSASSSSEFTSEASWQIPAAIGGSVGAAALIGGISALVAKKYCSTKGKKSDTSDSTGSDVELEDKGETTASLNRETPASSRILSPFEAKEVGFTEHPTFMGAVHGHVYEIWKTITEEEADIIRPLTSISIPSFSSEKIDFTLGQGHFGATYVGSNPQSGEIFAIKEVYGTEAVDESLQEGEIVHSLGDYPHIMPLVDYIHFAPSKKNQEPRLLQVMPLAYINGIGFKELLTHSSTTDREKIVSDSLWQMMMGLEYIHKKGVDHLDIKSDNTLYMKDGTLKLADFGRAQQVGENDQIADMNSLGDIRKFSPEIVAFIRKCQGGTAETVESFSGKAADIWAAGLYIWELLEDNTDNLFSTKPVPLAERVNTYTYEAFEQFVAAINALNKNYSSNLLTLLRQVLAVNPEMRLTTFQVLKRLSKGMSNSERKTAFEEVIRLANQGSTHAEEHPTTVYAFADPKMYVNKSTNQQQLNGYLPSDFYTKEKL